MELGKHVTGCLPNYLPDYRNHILIL